MPQTGTSGLMSGEGKRSHWPWAHATAPFLDSTRRLTGVSRTLIRHLSGACGMQAGPVQKKQRARTRVDSPFRAKVRAVGLPLLGLKAQSAAMNNDLPYRPCVGVALANRRGEVFIGHRLPKRSEALDARSWQMPQGGIDEGEAPLEAAKRELWEETNVRSVELIFELPQWLNYDLPDGARGRGGTLPRPVAEVVPVPLVGQNSEIDVQFPADGRHRAEWTRGGGSVSNACPTWSCRSSGKSTKPSRRFSRRWLVPPAGKGLDLLAGLDRRDRLSHRLGHLLAQAVIGEVDLGVLQILP